MNHPLTNFTFSSILLPLCRSTTYSPVLTQLEPLMRSIVPTSSIPLVTLLASALSLMGCGDDKYIFAVSDAEVEWDITCAEFRDPWRADEDGDGLVRIPPPEDFCTCTGVGWEALHDNEYWESEGTQGLSEEELCPYGFTYCDSEEECTYGGVTYYYYGITSDPLTDPWDCDETTTAVGPSTSCYDE